MAQDVRDAFGPCEVMCKCFGLLPVYFRAELTFHQKVTNCLHLVAIYGLLAWSTGICMPRDMVNYSLSMVMNRSVVLLIVAYYVQPFCNTVGCWVFSEKIYLILDQIGSVDEKVSDRSLNKPNILIIKTFFSARTNWHSNAQRSPKEVYKILHKFDHCTALCNFHDDILSQYRHVRPVLPVGVNLL